MKLIIDRGMTFKNNSDIKNKLHLNMFNCISTKIGHFVRDYHHSIMEGDREQDEYWQFDFPFTYR